MVAGEDLKRRNPDFGPWWGSNLVSGAEQIRWRLIEKGDGGGKGTGIDPLVCESYSDGSRTNPE